MRRRLSSCAGFSVLSGSARELDAALSEAVEEGEELVVGPVAAGRVGSWWGGAGDRLFFDFEVGVHVDLGGLDAFMAEPQSDGGEVDTGVQERHRAGVAQHVGAELFRLHCWAVGLCRGGVTGNESTDSVSAERRTFRPGEHGRVGSARYFL